MNLSIFGSCVTRDAFVLSGTPVAINYIARQSIISAMCPIRAPAEISLKNDEEKKFNGRMAAIDLRKETFKRLNPEIPLVIDLIDERFRLARFANGFICTYSTAAVQTTNLPSLKKKFIPPCSEERTKLMDQALPAFIKNLTPFRKIILHRAFFAPGEWEMPFEVEGMNRFLASMYDRLADSLDNCVSLEVPEQYRQPSPRHKWGHEPMHYIDDYYKCFLERLSSHLDSELAINPSATLQNN